MSRLDSVQFYPLLAQSDAVIEQIRQMRNANNVRRYMYTDHVISIDEHLNWVNGLKTDERQCVMIVKYNDDLAGLVSLSRINKIHKTAEWAFYLNDSMQGKGIGGVVEFKLLELAFSEFELEKLNCEVIDLNENVVKMHQKFGFVIEGVRRSNVLKNDLRCSVVFLGITRTEWMGLREMYLQKFA